MGKRKLRTRKKNLIGNQIKEESLLQSASHNCDIEKCVSCQEEPGSLPLCEHDDGTDYNWILQECVGITLKLSPALLKKSKICKKCSEFLNKLVMFKDRLGALSYVREHGDDSINYGGNMTLPQAKTEHKAKTKCRPKKLRRKGYWMCKRVDDSSDCSWYSDKSDDAMVSTPVVKRQKKLKKPATVPISIKKENELDDDLDLVLNTEVYD